MCTVQFLPIPYQPNCHTLYLKARQLGHIVLINTPGLDAPIADMNSNFTLSKRSTRPKIIRES